MSLPVTSKEENSKPVYLTCMPKYIYFIVFFLNTASVQNAQWCGKKIKWNQFQDWPWWVRIVTVTDMKNNYNNYMERASAFSDDLVWLYRSYESVLNRDCFASSSKFLAVHLTLSFLCWKQKKIKKWKKKNILKKKKKKKRLFWSALNNIFILPVPDQKTHTIHFILHIWSSCWNNFFEPFFAKTMKMDCVICLQELRVTGWTHWLCEQCVCIVELLACHFDVRVDRLVLTGSWLGLHSSQEGLQWRVN